MEGYETGSVRRRIVKGIVTILFWGSVLILTLNYIIKQNPSWAKKEPEVFEVLSESSVWRYMEEGKDPSVGKVWTTLNYDAGFWKAGYGSFGTDMDYGVNNLLEKKGGEKGDIHSYFFRHEFEVKEEQAEKIGSITGEISYKDAVVIYLNGNIIFTGNIPAGGYETNLEAGASEEREEICSRMFQVTELSSLQAGKNVLSVEVHQSDEKKSDIYFAFPAFSLLEDKVTEPDYDMRHMILTKSERDDELYVNYVSGQEESYRVEYMEAAYYKGEESFARHGATEYMGSRYLENGYLNRVKLKRLKENMDYVYRVIRVGGKEGSEVFRFSTGRNYRAVFGVTAASGKEWNRKEENINFLAVLGKENDAGDERGTNADIMLSNSELWRQTPCIYAGAGSLQEETLSGSIFGTDNFYLVERDIMVIGIRNAEEADAIEYIQQIRHKTKHKWIVLLNADPGPAEHYFDAGVTAVMQRTEEGKILTSYREEGKIAAAVADYAEVAGYENQLEVQYFNDRGKLLGTTVWK